MRGESRGVGLSGSQRALLSKKGFFVFAEEDSFLILFGILMFKNVSASVSVMLCCREKNSPWSDFYSSKR